MFGNLLNQAKNLGAAAAEAASVAVTSGLDDAKQKANKSRDTARILAKAIDIDGSSLGIIGSVTDALGITSTEKVPELKPDTQLPEPEEEYSGKTFALTDVWPGGNKLGYPTWRSPLYSALFLDPFLEPDAPLYISHRSLDLSSDLLVLSKLFATCFSENNLALPAKSGPLGSFALQASEIAVLNRTRACLQQGCRLALQLPAHSSKSADLRDFLTNLRVKITSMHVGEMLLLPGGWWFQPDAKDAKDASPGANDAAVVYFLERELASNGSSFSFSVVSSAPLPYSTLTNFAYPKVKFIPTVKIESIPAARIYHSVFW
jgi:hypothetical protein